MQLSKKQETFSQNFCCIFGIYIKFWTFSRKKKTLIADLFPKLRTPKNVLKQISKKSHLKGHFSERYVEREEALLKSGRHNL